MTAETTTSFWSRHRWALVLTGVVAIAGVVVGVSAVAQADASRAQETEISSLQAELQALEASKTVEANAALQDSVGVSAARVKTDTKIIQDFATLGFTWDSGETYEETREALKSQFDLTETSPFLATFMPPSRFNQDSEGKRYYYLDAVGLNTALDGDVEAAVVSVEGTNYHYAVFADVAVSADGPTTTDARGEPVALPEATRRVMLTLTVDAEGGLSEINGIPPSGSMRSSS